MSTVIQLARPSIMLWIAVLVLLLLSLALAACNGIPHFSTPPTSTPVVVNVRMTAALLGNLSLENGCLRVADHYTLMWPPEFTVSVRGETVEVHDGLTGNRAVWQIGQPIFMGGGETPGAIGGAKTLPSAGCAGPYWRVGGIEVPPMYLPTLEAMRTPGPTP